MTRRAHAILKALGTPLLIHQPSYSMVNRWIKDELLATLDELGVGCIAFSPLAQGLLTKRYLDGIPADTRAGRGVGSFSRDMLTDEVVGKVAEMESRFEDREVELPDHWGGWRIVPL